MLSVRSGLSSPAAQGAGGSQPTLTGKTSKPPRGGAGHLHIAHSLTESPGPRRRRELGTGVQGNDTGNTSIALRISRGSCSRRGREGRKKGGRPGPAVVDKPFGPYAIHRRGNPAGARALREWASHQEAVDLGSATTTRFIPATSIKANSRRPEQFLAGRSPQRDLAGGTRQVRRASRLLRTASERTGTPDDFSCPTVGHRSARRRARDLTSMMTA